LNGSVETGRFGKDYEYYVQISETMMDIAASASCSIELYPPDPFKEALSLRTQEPPLRPLLLQLG